jgi:hypothetical protein
VARGLGVALAVWCGVAVGLGVAALVGFGVGEAVGGAVGVSNVTETSRSELIVQLHVRLVGFGALHAAGPPVPKLVMLLPDAAVAVRLTDEPEA